MRSLLLTGLGAALGLASAPTLPQEPPRADDPLTTSYSFCAWAADGSLVAGSPSLASRAGLETLEFTSEAGLRRIDAPGGGESLVRFGLTPPAPPTARAWRVRGPLTPPLDRAGSTPPDSMRVVVAADLGPTQAALDRLAIVLLAAWLLSSVGCAGILTWVVHRSLQPLERLRRELRELDAHSLGERLASDALPDELVPVVGQLNQLLARLQEAFDREQAFSAHAAHELRTPLAGLRATLEVSLSRERSTRDYREAEEDCLEITLRLERVVETLLAMARLDAGALSARAEELALHDVVESVWSHLGKGASHTLPPLHNEIPPDARVSADAALLRRVLSNLLDNAATYGARGEPVRVGLAPAAGRPGFFVANTAPSATAELATKAFEPFWRADAARSSSGVHAGLGLALCRKILELMGGTIEAEVEDATFTVHVALGPRSAER